MKRLLWLGIGIAVGALVVRQVTKTVQAHSPSGLAGSARESAVGLLDTVRDFVTDVREAMAEREADIRTAFDEGISLEELAERYDELDDDEDGAGVRR